MTVTIKDIARVAEVTIGTVSRALNNEPGVKENTRTKIIAIAREMNYLPNLGAKRLADKKSKSIGVIWYPSKNLFFNYLCAEIQTQGAARGHSVLVSFSSPETAIRMLDEHFIDYIIYWCGASTWIPSAEFIKAREAFQGVMLLMGGGKLEGSHRLDVDRKNAIFTAVKHLADLGHQRIAFVGAKATEKLIGFTLGLLSFKLEYSDDTSIYYADHNEGIPREKLIQALQQEPHIRPTAFILDAYAHVIPFIQLTKKLQLQIPKDISVIVYDSIPEMENILDVQLTTVGPSIEGLAKQAIEILLSNHENGVWQDVTLPSELTIRDSTAAPSTK